MVQIVKNANNTVKMCHETISNSRATRMPAARNCNDFRNSPPWKLISIPLAPQADLKEIVPGGFGKDFFPLYLLIRFG